MLAAVLPDYGPASRLKVQLVDLPRLPLGKMKSTEVIVEVHAASVNPTDWKQRKGTLSQICPLNLPTILGIDFAGMYTREKKRAVCLRSLRESAQHTYTRAGCTRRGGSCRIRRSKCAAYMHRSVHTNLHTQRRVVRAGGESRLPERG
jgi:hypothetical protein